MSECFLCFIVGFAVCGILTFVMPENIRGVNEHLIKHGMAYYDSATDNIIWHYEKPCK